MGLLDYDLSAFTYIMIFLLIMVVIAKIFRWHRLKHYNVPARDVSKGHRWYMVDVFSKPTYCNISNELMLHGAECDSCGVCVEDCNMKQANLCIPCKPLAVRGGIMLHHWVRGNLPLNSKCIYCTEICSDIPEVSDLRCCWCRRTIHDKCVSNVDDLCDLGDYRKHIIPPDCVALKWVGFKGRRHLIVKSVTDPAIPNWSPIIVVANRKSGNNDGEYLLREFRNLLNPGQVIDLHDIPPENGIEWCHLLPMVQCKVLVCGGDGTIGWVLNAMDKLKLQTPPQVCILPLGTGNDLSRVLGWGEGYSGEIDVTQVLDQIDCSKPAMLDRWQIEITHEKHFGVRLPRKKVFMMNNYASIGVDALVTLNFHKRRESWPSLFTHRIINKFCYLTYGTKDVWARECINLHKKLKVELDGRCIDLPEIEGLVLLNIASWGGGCRPWELSNGDGEDTFKPARSDDGLLEVMALYSSFHIAQMKVGLAAPVKLGQAKTVKITLFGGNAPMQVDGEPWEQHPAEITVSCSGQAMMLAAEDNGSH